ncbi:hypothetical protein L1987_40672 [Smallanthus sonchifolius]|uniref:Uncharacterized protein n=1 Tax=Smallanthus sonchifolius TaxID=185202 RepID=A0ACB9GUN6_9ASTR|nr:hypothetical protein L1987_40672 [Smallanthus sonchifolius]
MATKKRDEVEAETHVSNGGSHKKRKKKKHKTRDKEHKNVLMGGDDVTPPTVSIALPGSIIDNTQSFELATRLAGQIARAATIFRINEKVVIFDNQSESLDDLDVTTKDTSDENESGTTFLIRILKYLETPQYLRKALFQKHNSLRFVGLLPSLDAPHHLRKHEWAPYREGLGDINNIFIVEEFVQLIRSSYYGLNMDLHNYLFIGVTLMQQAPSLDVHHYVLQFNKLKSQSIDHHSLQNVVIDQAPEPGTRVTVAMGTDRRLDDTYEFMFQLYQPRPVVSSSKPREEAGMYWGYKGRYAANISSVLKCCPYKGGYDYLIGTSEHGNIVKSSELQLPSFRYN